MVAPPRRRRTAPSSRCSLAVLEDLELPAPVGDGDLLVAAGHGADQPLDERPRGGALEHHLADLLGDEGGAAPAVQRAELVPVAGEQPLGDQLQQHRVVALEGGEDVGVGLQAGQPVLGQVAGAAARLAARLDGAGGVPGLRGLETGGPGLQLPLPVLVDRPVAALHLVQRG